jgi:hypothetical protein
VFAHGDHFESTPELLDTQESKSVSRDHTYTGSCLVNTGSGNGASATEGKNKGSQCQVSFCFAGSCGDPQEITDLPVLGGRVDRRLEAKQNESKLEWMPHERTGIFSKRPSSLNGHRFHRKAKGQSRILICAYTINPALHPPSNLLTYINEPVHDFPISLPIALPRESQGSNPSPVSIDERLEAVLKYPIVPHL